MFALLYLIALVLVSIVSGGQPSGQPSSLPTSLPTSVPSGEPSGEPAVTYPDPICDFIAATDIETIYSEWSCNSMGQPITSSCVWLGLVRMQFHLFI